ncbi:MAG: MEDS domain-containing protein, partial [Desulfovibrionaceae bacterium]|nr:MEDS domain-containing protein [Desulfovibrionaceae bacterium]
MLSSFLSQGLKRNERVLYLADGYSRQAVLDFLVDLDPNVVARLASGEVNLVMAKEVLDNGNGPAHPVKVLGLLRAEAERAKAEGFAALRAAGEMTWALGNGSDAGRLVELEKLLNDFFPESNCLGLCLYDRRRFPPETL